MKDGNISSEFISVLEDWKFKFCIRDWHNKLP